jgi:hypothetical protein
LLNGLGVDEVLDYRLIIVLYDLLLSLFQNFFLFLYSSS